MTEEELYEYVMYHYTIDRISDPIEKNSFLLQNKERRRYLAKLSFTKSSLNYLMYYELIRDGLSKEEIFDMSLKQRMTYAYLFDSKRE